MNTLRSNSGSNEKEAILVGFPQGEVKLIVPLVAPLGITADICELLFTTKDAAGVPLNLTEVTPINPEPEITTVSVAFPLKGMKDEMTGAGETVIVIAFDVAGLEITQLAFEVITQVITFPLLKLVHEQQYFF